MAITTYTIGAGGDIDSLISWHNTRMPLAVSGDTEIAILKNGIYTSGLVVSGWASGVNIIIASENRHNMNISTSANSAKFINWTGGNGTLFRIMSNVNFTLSGIFASFTNNDVFKKLWQYEANNAGPPTLSTVDCFVIMREGYGNGIMGVNPDGGVAHHSGPMINISVDNCIFSGQSSSIGVIGMSYNSGPNTRTNTTFRNTTVINCSLYSLAGYSNTSALLKTEGCLLSSVPSVSGTYASSIRITASAGTTAFFASSIDCIYSNPSSVENQLWNYRLNNTYDTVFMPNSVSAGAVGFVSSIVGNFSLVDDPGNIAIDYAANSSYPAYDILGTARTGIPDAGAVEIYEASEIIELIALAITRLQLT